MHRQAHFDRARAGLGISCALAALVVCVLVGPGVLVHPSSEAVGLNPASDGKVLRIPLPALTEERRKEMSRLVHKYAEEGRNQVRMVRRDANERLKLMQELASARPAAVAKSA